MLLFRTVPEDGYHIQDWLSVLKPLIRADFPIEPTEPILSPTSPGGTVFTNPFGATRENRSGSNANQRPEFKQRTSSNHTSNTYPHAPRERPSAVISPSPSLRSRRSDLSSQASSQHPSLGFNPSTTQNQNYAPLGPTDLPSPASTSAYDTQFIEGWTSAQGRSSALSTHTRGSNSIASAVSPFASSPPGPRETILDRAFMMRYIPGSEKLADVNEDGSSESAKISSIARFEKLMREQEERRMQRAGKNSSGQEKRRSGRNRTGWELVEESDSEDSDDESEEDSDSDSEPHTHEIDLPTPYDPSISIPTPAQRALDYISGRQNTPHSPPPSRSKTRPLSPSTGSPPIPFLNQQAMNALHQAVAEPYSKGDSQGAGRPKTGNQPGKRRSRPHSIALPSRSASTNTIPTLRELQIGGNPAVQSSTNLKNSESIQSSEKENRGSTTSLKRLSFQEFAKRLSSTSSLLLVQTNVSTGSHPSSGSTSRRESASARESLDSYADTDAGEGVWPGRGGAGLRTSANYGVGMRGGEGGEREGPRDRERDHNRDWESEREKRCGWRGSVGVFGDGGFL